MPDATPAVVFVLMLIAPCAIAVWGDRKKKAKQNASVPLEPKKSVDRKGPLARRDEASPQSSSMPVYTPPVSKPVVASPAAQPQTSRIYKQGPDPYERTASLYAQPASAFIETTDATVNRQDAAEALLAQAAVAKAKAAALAEAARAAQAKAHAAAEVANRAARVAASAHKAAQTERDLQAQITAQEQARTASGEHVLPETHPSLDFPRSGRPRRAA